MVGGERFELSTTSLPKLFGTQLYKTGAPTRLSYPPIASFFM